LHATDAYYTAKLNFPMIFPSKVAVGIIQVCVLYANFYDTDAIIFVLVLVLITKIALVFYLSRQARIKKMFYKISDSIRNS